MMVRLECQEESWAESPAVFPEEFSEAFRARLLHPRGAIAPIPGLVRVGGTAAEEIYAPAPEFPSVARHAKITGVVLLDAVIDEHGTLPSCTRLKEMGC